MIFLTNMVLVISLFQDFLKILSSWQKSFLSQSGRKKKLQSNEILCMKRIANENPFLCGQEVRNEAMLHSKIATQMASSYLRNFELLHRIAKRANYHSAKHMSKRRQFCISVKQWDFLRWLKIWSILKNKAWKRTARI